MIAAAILPSFLVVGVWHGDGSLSLIFSALQGIGIVTAQCTTLSGSRKSWDGMDFSLTLFVFANTSQELLAIRATLRSAENEVDCYFCNRRDEDECEAILFSIM